MYQRDKSWQRLQLPRLFYLRREPQVTEPLKASVKVEITKEATPQCILLANEPDPAYLSWNSCYYTGYDTPWQILSAIHLIESGRQVVQKKTSSAGAVGPMQFMPCTWYNKNGVCKTKVDMDMEMVDSTAIKGYYFDAQGDGIADARNLQDAIGAASNYLQANYQKSGSWWTAIWHYNRADWYVRKILNEAKIMGFTP